MDTSSNVYVVHSGINQIQKFDSDGNFITTRGERVLEMGELNWPCGIAVDNSGNVYIADTRNNRIQKFEIHPAGGKGEIVAQITAGADDGFVARTPEYFSADSKALTIGTDLKFDAFLRFSDLKIPAKATITKAYISVVPAVTNLAGPMVNISAADAANPSEPTTSSDFYARKRTASSVNWGASSWDAGESENSTDISSVIQELVDSYDYSAGAPIMIFLDIAGEGTENQYFAAFENAEYDAPKLYIVYSTDESTGDSTDGELDITPPLVTIISPEEGKTYYGITEIALEVTANEPISGWSYSLNGADSVPFVPSTTIAASIGDNSLVIYAEDNTGNVGSASVSFKLRAKIPI